MHLPFLTQLAALTSAAAALLAALTRLILIPSPPAGAPLVVGDC